MTKLTLKQQLIKGVKGNFLLKITNLFLVFFTGILFARLLGPENYGAYALILSVITFISIPILGGLPTLVMRNVAK